MFNTIEQIIKWSLSIILVVAVFFIPVRGYSQSRDAYVYSSIGGARVLVPVYADDSSSGSICALVYSGLTKIDKDLNVVPDLAGSWDVSDDGLTITFFLRKNVLWHDGTPFTAEDVRFTYETILDPAKGCPYISGFIDIKGIDVVDPYTIRFQYGQPYAPALSKFGMGIIPEHIFKGRDIKNSPFLRKPVGTGPYKFSKWLSGQYIILEANPDYYEGAPGIKYYVYRIIPDQAVSFLELVAGGVDSMVLNPYQYVYRSDTREFKDSIEKYKYLSHSYSYIGYNLNDPVLADKRVRQALSYAVNRSEIIDSVLLGLGEECTGPFLKGTPYYSDKAREYAYDPEKAKRLLNSAGWNDSDGDGVLDKNGEDLYIKLVTNQGNQVREDAATIVQKNWSDIGVRTDIQIIAWAAFLDQFINKRKFQAVMLGWSLPVDPDPYSVWHSSAMAKGGLNFVSYSNADVDELIEMGRREFMTEKRAEIYNKIHDIIAEDAPYTFLYLPYATPAINKRFKGIKPAPAGIGYNFDQWYVPEDEVKYKF